MSATMASFREQYEKALADGRLRENLLNFQRAYRGARTAAFEHFGTTSRLGVADPTFTGQRTRLETAKRGATAPQRRRGGA